MSCKYNNSMYTTIPPATFIEPQQTPSEFEEEEIEAYIDEERYEKQQIIICMWFEDKKFAELIKNEPRPSIPI